VRRLLLVGAKRSSFPCAARISSTTGAPRQRISSSSRSFAHEEAEPLHLSAAEVATKAGASRARRNAPSSERRRSPRARHSIHAGRRDSRTGRSLARLRSPARKPPRPRDPAHVVRRVSPTQPCRSGLDKARPHADTSTPAVWTIESGPSSPDLAASDSSFLEEILRYHSTRDIPEHSGRPTPESPQK